MSDVIACKHCHRDRAQKFFISEPMKGFEGICADCLPPGHKGVKRCRNCRLRLRTEDFGLTNSNLQSGVCRYCFDKDKATAVCALCKKDKPRKDFDCIVTMGGQKKRRRSCRECFKPPATSAKCSKCHEQFAIENFPRRSSGRRSKLCNDCYEPTTDYLRKCSKCGEKKERREFKQLLDARLARTCNTCPPRNPRNGGRQMRKLPRPCQFCSVDIWTAKPYEETLNIQYCSKACRNLALLKTPERCLQCGEDKKHSEFPRRQGNGIHRRRCYECVKRMRENKEMKARGQGSLRALRCSIKRRGKALNAQSDLAYRDVERLVEEGCVLCGNPAQCVTFTHEKAPPTKEHTKGCCYACRSLQGRRSLDEIIGWAMLVAQAHPESAPASPQVIMPLRKDYRPTALEERPEIERNEQVDAPSHAPLRKQKLKRYDLVPEHVHQGRQMGESFEEMLARFQRPAKVGRKRPKEKEDAP